MNENVRDIVLLVLGTIGFLHELLFGRITERPLMLALIAACLGLPLVLRGEDRLTRKGEEERKMREFYDRWGH